MYNKASSRPPIILGGPGIAAQLHESFFEYNPKVILHNRDMTTLGLLSFLSRVSGEHLVFLLLHGELDGWPYPVAMA